MIQVDLSNLKSEWTCEKCSSLMTFEDVLKVENQIMEKVKNLGSGSATVETINELELMVAPTHHRLVKLKFDWVLKLSGNLEESAYEHLEVGVKICEDLLPVVDKLGECVAKGKLAQALAVMKIRILSKDAKDGKLNKEEYRNAVKPYLGLHLHSKAILKKFNVES